MVCIVLLSKKNKLIFLILKIKKNYNTKLKPKCNFCLASPCVLVDKATKNSTKSILPIH